MQLLYVFGSSGYARKSMKKVVTFWLWVSGVAITAALFGVAGQAPAGAVSSGGKTYMSADNVLYAYVKGGETISASFIATDQIELLGLEKQDITVTLEGPQLEPQRCVLVKAAVVDRGCRFTDVVAPTTGVYRVSFVLPDTAKPYASIAQSVKWGGTLYSWDMVVKDGQTEKTGRIWSELYAIRQPIDVSYAADLTFYYVSENGYMYRANYNGYNGQISTFSADSVGITKKDECVSAYQSVQADDTKYMPSFGGCGGSFKLFFEQPSGDLPEQAKRWDGKGDEWIIPKVVSPKVSQLRFESDKTGDLQSGTIRYKLQHFVGQYRVEIDTDGDGSFNGKDDVRIAQTMKRTSNDTQVVKFSGVDAAGQVIPASQPIGIRIMVDKVAEIHLVNADVEGRIGGIEIMRLNGENAPSSRVCWNDSYLAPLAIELSTPKVDGRDCAESADKGVHGWPYAAGSWGDNRYIDDWAYAAAKIDGATQIRYPDGAEVTTGPMRHNKGMIIAGAVVLTLLFVGLVAGFVIRRQRQAAQLKKARQQQATYVPGPGDPPSLSK